MPTPLSLPAGSSSTALISQRLAARRVPRREGFSLTYILIAGISMVVLFLAYVWMTRLGLDRQTSTSTLLNQDPDDFDYSLAPVGYKTNFQMRNMMYYQGSGLKPSDEEIKKFTALCMQAKPSLEEKLLPCLTSFEVLESLKSRKPRMQVNFLLQQQMQGALGHVYFDAKEEAITVRLAIEPYLSQDNWRELGRNFANEMFHVMCEQANSNKTNSASEYSATPFLNAAGIPDVSLRDRFSAVIKEAIDNVNELRRLHKENPKDKRIKNAERVLANYQPNIRFQSKKIPTGAPEIILFIGDFLMRYNQIYSPVKINDPTSPYNNLSYDDQLIEMASFIWDFPAAIKQFFASGLCKYIKEYMRFSENPCAIPLGPQCPQLKL